MTDAEMIELILLENSGQDTPALERFDKTMVERVRQSLLDQQYLQVAGSSNRENGSVITHYRTSYIGHEAMRDLRAKAARNR